MQLKYRGISYDYTPPMVEMEPSQIVGQYRGLEWRFRRPQALSVQQPTLNLVYRGVPYTTGQTQSHPESILPPVTDQPRVAVNSPVHNLARALMTSHSNIIKQRQESMLERTAEQVGLG